MEEPNWWDKVVWILLSPRSVATIGLLGFIALLIWKGQR